MAERLKISKQAQAKLFGVKFDTRATFIQRSRAVSAEQKATYHQILGAGRSGVKRRFIGLTDADKQAIADQVGAHVSAVLRKTG